MFVWDKSPEKETEIVCVHLHLLKAESTERPQPDALQKSLQRNLNDPSQDRDSRKFYGRKDLDFFIEHLLNVGC